jgi:hypothetical protein
MHYTSGGVEGAVEVDEAELIKLVFHGYRCLRLPEVRDAFFAMVEDRSNKAHRESPASLYDS